MDDSPHFYTRLVSMLAYLLHAPPSPEFTALVLDTMSMCSAQGLWSLRAPANPEHTLFSVAQGSMTLRGRGNTPEGRAAAMRWIETELEGCGELLPTEATVMSLASTLVKWANSGKHASIMPQMLSLLAATVRHCEGDELSWMISASLDKEHMALLRGRVKLSTPPAPSSIFQHAL